MLDRVNNALTNVVQLCLIVNQVSHQSREQLTPMMLQLLDRLTTVIETGIELVEFDCYEKLCVVLQNHLGSQMSEIARKKLLGK